jgi:hypothetical protein
MSMNRGHGGGVVGIGCESILDAIRPSLPKDKAFEITDIPKVSVLYVECRETRIGIVSFDLLKMPLDLIEGLKRSVAAALDLDAQNIRVCWTHTHSVRIRDGTDHAILVERSVTAARAARAGALAVDRVGFLRTDTGNAFNINRRSQNSPFGVWSLMQSKGCVDNGNFVDGTEWAREKIRAYGGNETDTAALTGPVPATRKNDPHLDLILFEKAGGGHAAGLVRYTGHPVTCSDSFWKPNVGRDYPGVLCDRLTKQFACPFIFLQGPTGDHRMRHTQVGIGERNRLAEGLSQLVIQHSQALRMFPFDRLESWSVNVPCAVRDEILSTSQAMKDRAREIRATIATLPHGAGTLLERKTLNEQAIFYDIKSSIPDDLPSRTRLLPLSCLSFGPIRMMMFPGETASVITAGMDALRDGLTVVTAYTDYNCGYLVTAREISEGGYEAVLMEYHPEHIEHLRTIAEEYLRA